MNHRITILYFIDYEFSSKNSVIRFVKDVGTFESGHYPKEYKQFDDI